MNYRHAYHAGNFADVLKHMIIVQCLKLMQQKEGGICVLDAFAGIGIYDLQDDEAIRSPEFIDGINRLWTAKDDFAPIIKDYLTEQSIGTNDNQRFYLGSPFLAAQMLRPQDRLIVNELHPEDFISLRENMREFGGKKAQKRIEVTNIDAWQIIKAKLPPIERRGLIIIDPPFENPNEFDRLIQAAQEGKKRFANGVYILWHANKNETQTNQYRAALKSGNDKLLWVQMQIKSADDTKGLRSAGLSIINAPYGLSAALKIALPQILPLLAQNKGANFQIREDSNC